MQCGGIELYKYIDCSKNKRRIMCVSIIKETKEHPKKRTKVIQIDKPIQQPKVCGWSFTF